MPVTIQPTTLKYKDQNGTWHQADCLKGEQGIQGPVGATGATGPVGATGATPNLTIGTVTDVPYGTASSATITGTAAAPVLNLQLQHGQSGNETIDDTKGAGDTDFVWSASKTYNEVNGLKSALSDNTGASYIEGWTSGYIKTNGSSGSVCDIETVQSTSLCRHVVLECNAGDVFSINLVGGSSSRAFTFLKSDKKIIGSPRASASEAVDRIVTAPDDAKYLVLNDARSDSSTPWTRICYIGRTAKEQIEEVDARVAVNERNDCSQSEYNLENCPASILKAYSSESASVGNYASVPYGVSKTLQNLVVTKIKLDVSKAGTVSLGIYKGTIANNLTYDSSKLVYTSKITTNATGVQELDVIPPVYVPDGCSFVYGKSTDTLLFKYGGSSVAEGHYYIDNGAFKYSSSWTGMDITCKMAVKDEDVDILSLSDLYYQLGRIINYQTGVYSDNSRFGLSQMIYVGKGSKILLNAPKTGYTADLMCGVHLFNGSTWVGYASIKPCDIYSIPDTANNIRIAFGGSSGTTLTQDIINSTLDGCVIRKRIKPFEGKRVSIIGPSDSTFAGYIPAENVSFYSGNPSGSSFYGVGYVGDCWWNIGITEVGALPLINDSWSGSTVATGVRTPTVENAYTPFVDPSRCQNLHAYIHGGTEEDTLVTADNISTLRQSPWDNDPDAFVVGEYVKEVDPDIILINGGGNDYVWNCPMGTYDGHTALDTSETNNFRSAYANLINRIQQRYPLALVICLLPIYLVRPAMTSDADKAQVNLNSNGNTYRDFFNAIREIAELKGCTVIDGYTHGFSRYNYYDLFCEDSATRPVHPNALGHIVIGEDFAEKLRRLGSTIKVFA